MTVVKHVYLEVPISVVGASQTDVDWALQHISHQIKMLLKQKKWQHRRFGGCTIRQTDSILQRPQK